MDSVRLGENTFNSSEDCYMDRKLNAKVCASPPIDVKVEQIMIHPRYGTVQSQLKNDIALLRLAQEVNFTGKLTQSC